MSGFLMLDIELIGEKQIKRSQVQFHVASASVIYVLRISRPMNDPARKMTGKIQYHLLDHPNPLVFFELLFSFLLTLSELNVCLFIELSKLSQYTLCFSFVLLSLTWFQFVKLDRWSVFVFIFSTK